MGHFMATAIILGGILPVILADIVSTLETKKIWNLNWKSAYKRDCTRFLVVIPLYVVLILFPFVLFPLIDHSIFMQGQTVKNIPVFIYWIALFVTIIVVIPSCVYIFRMPKVARLSKLRPNFFVELRWEIESLPLISHERLENDIWGKNKQIIFVDTPDKTCYAVHKFFCDMQKTVIITDIKIEHSESWPGLRAIGFYTKNGTEYFDGVVIMKYSWGFGQGTIYDIRRAVR